MSTIRSAYAADPRVVWSPDGTYADLPSPEGWYVAEQPDARWMADARNESYTPLIRATADEAIAAVIGAPQVAA